MLQWIKSWFVKQPVVIPPRIIEHRGMKGYFDSAMIEEFEKAGIDYEKEFRDAVNEVLDEEMAEDEDNPYA